MKQFLFIALISFMLTGCSLSESANKHIVSEVQNQINILLQQNADRLKVLYHKIIKIFSVGFVGYIIIVLSYAFNNRSMASMYKVSTIAAIVAILFMPYEAQAVTLGEIIGDTFAPGKPGSFIWKMLALAVGSFITENITASIGKSKIAQYTNVGTTIVALLLVLGLIYDALVYFAKFVGIEV